MTKQSLYTIALSVLLSVAASTAVNLAVDKQREPVLPDVVRAKRVELIDAQGRIRGTFGLAKNGGDDVGPHLIMRDADGRDSIYLGLDLRGEANWHFRTTTGTEAPWFSVTFKTSMMERSPGAKTSRTSQVRGVFG